MGEGYCVGYRGGRYGVASLSLRSSLGLTSLSLDRSLMTPTMCMTVDIHSSEVGGEEEMERQDSTQPEMTIFGEISQSLRITRALKVDLPGLKKTLRSWPIISEINLGPGIWVDDCWILTRARTICSGVDMSALRKRFRMVVEICALGWSERRRRWEMRLTQDQTLLGTAAGLPMRES